MKRNLLATTAAAAAIIISQQAVADVVHLDDVIITGSECVGFDCVNGESFGFDTLRLKENNLRIKFQDTSNSASFPSNDWQITANDSSNGGANKFSIDDIDGGRTPFTIEAGAPSHSLYVEDGGRVGFGTSTPVVDLHAVNGNTPTLRLEQNGSSGFTPQTWDMAGNEANFFIRDVTNGAKLPFRIQPGAPSESLTIKSDGDIGLGTWNPSTALHLLRTNNTAKIKIEDTGSTADSVMLNIRNAGDPTIALSDSDTSVKWVTGMGSSGGTDDSFIISLDSTANPEFAIWPNGKVIMGANGAEHFKLNSTGELRIAGSIYSAGVLVTSDRSKKENFKPIDTAQVLTSIESLPITRWTFKDDSNDVEHIGPMAQDFYAAFNVGVDDKHINPMDVTAVALSGIQELSKRVSEKDVTIAELKQQLLTQSEQLAALEILVNKMAQGYANGMSAELTIE